MYVDGRDRSLAPHLIMEGTWEPWIADVVQSHLKAGMKAVEVGANVGFYSLLMARAIAPGGRLVCFEANRELATLVRQNLHINGYGPQTGTARVVASAVADTPGTRKFYTFATYMGGSSLLEIAAVEGDERTEVEVPCTTLDLQLSDFGPVDFMKIDAEGAELMILQGATEVIGRSPNLTMVLEFHANRDLYDFLTACGLKVSPIRHDRPDLQPVSYEELAQLGLCDVLVTR